MDDILGDEEDWKDETGRVLIEKVREVKRMKDESRNEMWGGEEVERSDD